MKVAIVFNLFQVKDDEDIIPDDLTEDAIIKNVREAFEFVIHDITDSLFDINGRDFVDFEVRVQPDEGFLNTIPSQLENARTLVEKLYSAGFSDHAYALAADLDAQEALLKDV